MNNIKTIESKIKSIEELKKLVDSWKKINKKIVFTNGCFDILHLGHVYYLSEAANLGDIMIIGLNSDSSVRKIKGSTRPINNETSRSKVLASLFFIDAIVMFDEETPYNLIKTISPDILVKGSDYKMNEIIGSDIVLAEGGKVITIDFVEGYSTSEIEKRIIDAHKKLFFKK